MKIIATPCDVHPWYFVVDKEHYGSKWPSFAKTLWLLANPDEPPLEEENNNEN